MQQQQLHYVVDIDIKGFFDNVNHNKLLKQIWSFGIRDQKLLKIIKIMLKAPIQMPNNTIISNDNGTLQGGILLMALLNVRGGAGDITKPDLNARPQDNLYLAVNSEWIEKAKIPSDRSRISSFDGIDLNIEKS